MSQYSHGLLLGKFLPPHRGHVYLANFARHFVDHLTIVVGTLKNEPIAGELRFTWMQELFPNCTVVHLAEELPQDPSEHTDFWQLWQTALQGIAPFAPDVVFASEAYGHRLAEVLGARFIPVDPDRSIMPISGTAVRENPYQHWDFLPMNVRRYFLKRICIFGPESTGKSTLTKNLAAHFNTIAVPEYARTYLENLGNTLAEDKLLDIARGQCASEDALIDSARGLLFTDTDALLTTVWSTVLYQNVSVELAALAASRDYDLYLLTDVDVPWVADPIRYLPEERSSFFAACEGLLKAHQRRYVKLSGSWDQRWATAISAVSELVAGRLGSVRGCP